jgi:hypothetical protein
MTPRTLLLVGSLFLRPGLTWATPVELWATFDQGPFGEHRNVSIPLSSGHWRVGSETGGLASDDLIRDVLSDLRDVRIGGLGHYKPSGGFPSPYQFILSTPKLGEIDLDNSVSTFRIFGGFGSGGSSMWVASFEQTPESLAGFGFQFPGSSCAIPPFCAPFDFDRSAEFGKGLSFQWRLGHDSESATAFYVFSGGGRAVLTGDVDTGVPEPRTLLLAGPALALAVLKLRR